MSVQSFSQTSSGYLFSTIIPGSLPGIPVSIYLRSNFSTIATSPSLFTLLIIAISIIFGEYSDLLRIKTPYEFRRIVAEERDEEIKLYKREWLLKKVGIWGVFHRVDTSNKSNFYEEVSEDFVNELSKTLSISDEDLSPIHLYEGLLSYLRSDRSPRTERRRRRLLFLQNIRISVLTSVVLIIAIVIAERELILIASFVIVSVVFVAYSLIMIFSIYFLSIGRVDEEYVRSLIMDFHQKKT